MRSDLISDPLEMKDPRANRTTEQLRSQTSSRRADLSAAAPKYNTKFAKTACSPKELLYGKKLVQLLV